jgi:hypothetical protein
MKKLSEKDLALTAFVKATPKVISVLDYSKGFGHTDLVRPRHQPPDRSRLIRRD